MHDHRTRSDPDDADDRLRLMRVALLIISGAIGVGLFWLVLVLLVEWAR